MKFKGVRSFWLLTEIDFSHICKDAPCEQRWIKCVLSLECDNFVVESVRDVFGIEIVDKLDRKVLNDIIKWANNFEDEDFVRRNELTALNFPVIEGIQHEFYEETL